MNQLSHDLRGYEEEALLEILRIDDARSNFLDFTTYTKPDYQINWHHRVISSYLDRFVAGEITRLMLFEPPRHGKSEQVSRRLPAYAFGKNPDLNIIATSYADDLAQRNNRDVQRIIDSNEYRNLFPEVRLSGDNVRTLARGTWLRNSDIFEIVGRRGVYRSAGIDGGITGMGADIAIIDDPLKNHKQAYSPTIRESQWEWYSSTLMTRLEKDARVLLTMTRWHDDDVAGRLMKLMKEDPAADQWIVLSFPAILETPTTYDPRKVGEALWPQKMGLDRFAKIKANNKRVWQALFQQSPIDSSGNIFKKEWWRFYTELPRIFDSMIMSWDMSFAKGDENSFVVGQVWGRVKNDIYLIDQFRKQIGYTETRRQVKRMLAKYPRCDRRIVENKANGPAILDDLQTEYDLEAGNPEGSKVARATAISHLVEEGHVLLPSPNIAPWVLDFIEEHARFPRSDYDDQVDAMSQALSELEKELSFDTLEELLKGL